MPAAVSNQDGFRGRLDVVGLGTDTWTHLLNANFTQTTGVIFRVRFLFSETGGTNWFKIHKLQFNLAGAGFVDVSGTTPIQWALSGQYADDALTTQLLGSGTFVAGQGSEGDNLSPDSGNIKLKSKESEIEWALVIDAAQVADAQTFTLRQVESDGTAYNNYNQTPTITIDEPEVSANVPAVYHHRTRAA